MVVCVGVVVKELVFVLKCVVHLVDHTYGFGFLVGDGGGELAVFVKK